MTEEDFIARAYPKTIESDAVSCIAPSNIALVKYWGKYGEQLPENASVSFTLSNCHTKTTLSFQKKESEGFEFSVFLDDLPAPAFEPKILKFFERIEQYVPFLNKFSFTIHTSNSFPHSSGIASSASGMGALALCLVRMEQQMDPQMDHAYATRKASFLARLGSGSASRSIEGPLVVWGKHAKIEGSSNLFGVPYPYTIHPVFQNFQDTILLVDKGEKQVSSTLGHDLMHGHPFARQRFEKANANLSALIPVLETGDLSEFIQIVESEALSLHAMMMTSRPYFILMKPNTLEIINRIWAFRKRSGTSVCFTLDAGANVHVLYPIAEKEKIQTFIEDELTVYCKDGAFIIDQTGSGALPL
ncbi:diphosphomevalonate decarboxylase [Altibacter sp.]|uniref:diphosphomevalonate/mevalonate 3,5-bisphosphate decarboxylase family protein n=1 Tax=Altibacter sp. TaxID=2024823 RepID=UPI000C8D9EA4|nr:diphosphomevalonate decarboxylase [Altibacter sp.]MAP55326.1 diphosphomevalonate decarboxylase [Altibacter sp.]|tara:strand:+ start:281 stop:1357 length:1077 start_codon:yes stop_codon:yes gene_type:complete